MSLDLAEIVSQIELQGGRLTVTDAGRVQYEIPPALEGLLEPLREHREELADYLRQRPAKAEIPESVYQERAQRTLREMCLDYEQGTILWLEANHPSLYEAVTCHLPNKISELWSAHAPLEEFDAVLAELLEAHRQAVLLCRAARRVHD